MFADNLKKLMVEHGVTQAELAKKTGIGRSSISQYLSGKNEPTDERKALIADAVGCSVTELERGYIKGETGKMQRLSVDQVAKLLGMNHNTVRKGLQQGVFPWGYAVHTSEGRWAYFINAKKFAEVEGVTQ